MPLYRRQRGGDETLHAARAGKPLWEGYPERNAQLARVRVLFNIKGNLSHL